MPILFYVLLAVCIIYDGITIYSFFRPLPGPEDAGDIPTGCLMTGLGLVIGIIGAIAVMVLCFTIHISWWWMAVPGVLLLPTVILVILIVTDKSVNADPDWDEPW